MKRLEFYNKELESFVSIDPGLHTAFAKFESGSLIDTMIYHCPKELKGSDSSQRRKQLNRMSGAFVEKLEQLKPFNAVFLEGVQVYSSSMKSQVAAFRGDTVFLSQLVGVYFTEALRFTQNVYILLPREWRGNMPDQVVVNRIKRATNTVFKEHISDAVGIGLSVLGRL